MTTVLWWAGLCFLLASAGTWLARRYALARRMLDQPGERRSHAVATPRGGGISIMVAMLVALAALMWRAPALVPQLALAGLGLGLVGMVGWIDDHRPLSARLRLAVHGVAALLLAMAAIVAGGGLGHALLAFVAGLVLVNVWNFMDGIDGLATSQAVLVALAYIALAGNALPIVLGTALAAAALGFLPFNFPRARIFLGDVGSGALGYSIAALIALVAPGMRSGTWLLLLLPLSAFLVDATLTMAARMVRGERWWTPHVQHLYQRLAHRSRSHVRVTLGYAVWTLAAMTVLWAVRSRDAATIMCAVCGWYLLGAGIWFWAIRHLRSGQE